MQSTRLRTFKAFALLLPFLATACAGDRFTLARTGIGRTPAIATRADLRLVTERPNPATFRNGEPPSLVCSEPSPDVALALSTALQAQANVKTPSTFGAGAGVGYATNQAALELAGRTAAVVALRDSLFRACEAYANGVIGRSAYSMILSQYGDLLVTLVLGEAASSQKRGEGGHSVIAPGATINLPALPAAGGTAGSSTSSTSGSGGTGAGTGTGGGGSNDGSGGSGDGSSTSGEGSGANDGAAAAAATRESAPLLHYAAMSAFGAEEDVAGGGNQPLTLVAAKKPTKKQPPAKANKAADQQPAKPAAPQDDASKGGGAEAVAGLYYDPKSEFARLTKAAFVLCVSDRERDRTYPAPVRNELDQFCKNVFDVIGIQFRCKAMPKLCEAPSVVQRNRRREG